MLQSSLSSLKVAQTKFGECKESLGKIGSSAESKAVLVPLTSSVSLQSVYLTASHYHFRSEILLLKLSESSC